MEEQDLVHSWDVTPAEAIAIQKRLATAVVAEDRLGDVSYVAGVDVGWVRLWDGDEVVGALVRTRTNVNPVYVSTGHRISLETAVAYTLACTTRYKLPETTRQAHRLASGA